jgi:excisionase family DNA binding protein
MDAKTAAKMLGVPYTWLFARARANTVPHHRLGHYVRFDEDELVAWLADNRRGPNRGARRPQ